MSTQLCPCCHCEKVNGGRPQYSSLAEEAHAHARWHYFGCITTAPDFPRRHIKQLVVRYFDRRKFQRGEAWLWVAEDCMITEQIWGKCHTARTWCWYTLL